MPSLNNIYRDRQPSAFWDITGLAGVTAAYAAGKVPAAYLSYVGMGVSVACGHLGAVLYDWNQVQTRRNMMKRIVRRKLVRLRRDVDLQDPVPSSS